MIKKTYHLTNEGKLELENELAQLVAGRREAAERIAIARSQGDLSENAEYDAARDHQALMESRIAEIEDILQNSDIIVDGGNDSVVQLGDKVELNCDGKKVQYMVVGPVEADPIEGKISNESPLGAAILGATIGQIVSVETPKGTKEYKIESIK